MIESKLISKALFTDKSFNNLEDQILFLGDWHLFLLWHESDQNPQLLFL